MTINNDMIITADPQERFQSRGITPQYRVVQAEGASHAPTFSFQVRPWRRVRPS